MVSAHAQNPSWQAYLLPDGTVCVTDKALDAQVITSLTLGRGETRFVQVLGTPDYSFRSSGFYVAHVDADGTLIAGDSGKAKVQIYYTSTDYVELQVTVNKAPSSIKLSRKTVEMLPDSEFVLTCTLSKGSSGQVTFYSANEDVVTVDDSGKLEAVAPGTAQVFAETYNGKSDRVDVTVLTPPPAVISVNSTFTGYAHESFMLSAYLTGGFRETLSYLSADPSVCTVSQDGKVDCLKEGTALVRLSASGGAVADVAVTVKPAATAVFPASDRFFAYAGGEIDTDASTDGGSGAFAVESLDPSVAWADEENNLHALTSGTARIRFTAPGGASAEAKLIVYPFPEGCSFDVPEEALAISEGFQINLSSVNGPFLPLRFETDDPQVVSISRGGYVRAVSVGEAEIRAVFGGVSLAETISVVPYASALVFDEESLDMGAGDTVNIKARHLDGGGHIRYESLDPAFASVDEDGAVTAISPGSARIRAFIANGAETFLTVYVYPAAVNIYPEAEEAVIGQGDYVDLHCSFDSGTRAVLSWSSEDEGLLKADSSGRVTSVGGTGEAYAVASASSGARVRIRIQVIPAPDEMSLNAQPLTQQGLFTDYIQLKTGEEWDLDVRFSGISHAHYVCSTTDDKIVSVSEDGHVTALAKGTARVTVRSYNGLTREVLVEVAD